MVRKVFFAAALIVPLLISLAAMYWPGVLWLLVVVVPCIVLGLHDVVQRRHALLRIYPVIGHGRYLLEAFRPEIQQYFVESDIDETPFSREYRSVIYQRAKGDLDTRPFGTERDVNHISYEWMSHSLQAKAVADSAPRVRVGGPDCTEPYLASYLNASAMSFGALSKNAVRALNRAAKMAGFAHNTGEGGVSSYHLEDGGDLTWQIGTGYFGCRTPEGGFDPGAFAEKARQENIKMIEIKLSQGAKPGHGGILPAVKVSREIAEIRGVPMGRDCISPGVHTAFSTPPGLLEFVARLRALSGGKPVGFKLCIGYRSEFLSICKAMLETNILPDFVTVDGGEGGTGAAPLELSNSVGMPLRDGLMFAHNALMGIGMRSKVRLIAAGKIVTAFHMFRILALGADICNAARGMMFALGCIQARNCHRNICPVGIATQEPYRVQALDVTEKAQRVARYHHSTVHALMELVASAGIDNPSEIQPHHILRRTDTAIIKNFAQIYTFLPEGALLHPDDLPEPWCSEWQSASSGRW